VISNKAWGDIKYRARNAEARSEKDVEYRGEEFRKTAGMASSLRPLPSRMF
jgi:hypothetical protein